MKSRRTRRSRRPRAAVSIDLETARGAPPGFIKAFEGRAAQLWSLRVLEGV